MSVCKGIWAIHTTEKHNGFVKSLKYYLLKLLFLCAEKTVDLATVNLKKLKVKELKNILSDWDEQCRGCTEKSDYIKLIDELMPKYAPEAAEKRKRQELW